MPNPMITFHNIETNEMIEREMTDKEFKDYQDDLKASAIIRAEELSKSEQKTAIAARLGLTQDELNLLLG
jgi:hypothetical protein